MPQTLHVVYEVMHSKLVASVSMRTGEPIENAKPEEHLRRAVGAFETPEEANDWSLRLEGAAKRAGRSDFWDFPVEELEVGDLTKIEVLIEDFAQMRPM